MPELPEVEVLVRHLAPVVRGRTILGAQVRRAKVVAPSSPPEFSRTLTRARFVDVSRRGKYLLFLILPTQAKRPLTLVGHLGMTGRMYVSDRNSALPKHAAVVLDLGRQNFIFEDTRYFGRLTFDTASLAGLGPEPLEAGFTAKRLKLALAGSSQAIKIKLLDQRVVAGIGNIYASEALFRARISPLTAARRLSVAQITRLWQAIRETLTEAIESGSTVPLNYSGAGAQDGLFYFGRAPGATVDYRERLRVYDRAGKPCPSCGGEIRRTVLAARSTYYCPHCQSAGK